MKQPSVYLKMRVLGAIDTAPGRTRHERIHQVAALTFLDEEGHSRQFTWRTIQTWFYRYQNHGITSMTPQPRSDKGQARKVTPEELLEAIHAAKPHFHHQRTNKRAIYRFCVENGLLDPERIAQTTFYRFIREYQLLVPDSEDTKKRLAFSMKYANQLWQADTLRDFLHRELDRVGLGHHTFTPPAIDLVVRSADGVLRKARNLSVGCLIEAVRSARKTIDLDIVNRVLMQPHWQKDTDLVDY